MILTLQIRCDGQQPLWDINEQENRLSTEQDCGRRGAIAVQCHCLSIRSHNGAHITTPSSIQPSRTHDATCERLVR